MYKSNYARVFYIAFKNGFEIKVGEQHLPENFESQEIPRILELKRNKEMYCFDEHLSCQWIDCSEILAIGFVDSDKMK